VDLVEKGRFLGLPVHPISSNNIYLLMTVLKDNALDLLLKSDDAATGKCKDIGSYSCSYPRYFETHMATAELQVIKS
jgi:hypothetical protein